MIRQYELVERVRAYDPQADEALLNRAYVFAMRAHGAQKRHSGDPYFAHPLEVAGILTNLKLDTQTIVTALLHDTIEDTLATFDEIQSTFGAEIANLVEGVTKLSRLELQSEHTKQAENFRKLMVAMSNDIRVLLVKLADRLHNMRTLRFVPTEEKRRRIASETMDVYAPLAGRIGMQAMREELEDLAFAELNADMRDSLVKRLIDLRGRHGDLVVSVTDQLKRLLAEADVACSVSGREKRPYSIWRKMQEKSISFEQLSDVVAFRILVGSTADCYRALGTVHEAWRMVPGRFKDYISLPKKNGYQSLHSTVIGPQGQKIELQIRTATMHDIAEFGVAAHWHYKDKDAAHVPEEARAYRGLRDLVDLLEANDSPEEFLEHTKLEMFLDQVFCFTPKGDLIALPQGATPIDFAYAVHTSVGDSCVGCKINGRHMPLRTRLGNGDQVEILRSKGQKPSPTWEAIAVTGKARAAVRRFVRQQRREQYAALGRKMAERAIKAEGYEFSEKAIEGVLKTLKLPKVEDVYIALGEGALTGRALVETIYPGERPAPTTKSKTGKAPAKPKNGVVGAGVPIRGLIPGLAVHFARCCHPLPGDRIVGITASGVGVTIHTIDCETLSRFQDQPERWLDIAWQSDDDDPAIHIGRIRIVVANSPGALGALSTMVARQKGNISNLKITDRSADFFEMLVDIEVRDVRHLTNIKAALRAMPEVSLVERERGGGGEVTPKDPQDQDAQELEA